MPSLRRSSLGGVALTAAVWLRSSPASVMTPRTCWSRPVPPSVDWAAVERDEAWPNSRHRRRRSRSSARCGSRARATSLSAEHGPACSGGRRGARRGRFSRPPTAGDLRRTFGITISIFHHAARATAGSPLRRRHARFHKEVNWASAGWRESARVWRDVLARFRRAIFASGRKAPSRLCQQARRAQCRLGSRR